jgi:hypothetical protein
MNEPPPFWEEKARRMIGKSVLVGKTIIVEGIEPQRVQFHGLIESADARRGLAIRRADNGELEWLPPDLRAYFTAEPGIYTLRSTGEEVVDPDFLSNWTVERPAQRA